MKPRVCLRLSPKIYAELCRRAETSGATRAEIVEQALGRMFDPERAAGLEARLLKRMDDFDVLQGRMERELSHCRATLSHYIFYWLTQSEPIPDAERTEAHVLGLKRLKHFNSQVTRKLGASGRGPDPPLDANMAGSGEDSF